MRKSLLSCGNIKVLNDHDRHYQDADDDVDNDEHNTTKIVGGSMGTFCAE